MSPESYALLAILVGLVCGLIGHLMPSGTHIADRFKPRDPKAATAQGNWEGLEPK